MTTLLFLDDYHVGDPLFLADLGRRLAKLGPDGRTVILHRATEELERTLGKDDPLHDPQAAERVIRETNQGITRRLIEEGVPAVSMQGSDRRLFSIDQREVRAASNQWLADMVESGVVAVVSPLAESQEGPRAVDPVDAALALIAVLAARGEVQAAVFCSSRKEGLFRDGEKLESIEASGLEQSTDTIDVSAAHRLAQVAHRLVATNSAAIAKGPVLPGTVIRADPR